MHRSPMRQSTSRRDRPPHIGRLDSSDAISDEVSATGAHARSYEDGKLTNDDHQIFGEHGDEPGCLVPIRVRIWR